MLSCVLVEDDGIREERSRRRDYDGAAASDGDFNVEWKIVSASHDNLVGYGVLKDGIEG
jgi:hypothetical protein